MVDEKQNDKVDAQGDDGNGMEDFIDQIIIAKKSFVDLGKRISESLRPVMIEMEEARKRMEPALQHISAVLNSWGKAISLASERFIEQAKVWQERQKRDVVDMAKCGWFPNMHTFDYTPEKEVNDFDEFMTMHLNDDWTELTENIIELCPDRKHILETAFGLHKEGNYIASIPLFLSQADGICQEKFTYLFANPHEEDRRPLFHEKDAKTDKLLKRLIEEGVLQKGFLIDILLEPFKVETPFSKHFDPSEEKGAEEGPNRHGIMHGHRNYLDYDTELNSLKSLSLLAFVVFSTNVIFNNAKD